MGARTSGARWKVLVQVQCWWRCASDSTITPCIASHVSHRLLALLASLLAIALLAALLATVTLHLCALASCSGSRRLSGQYEGAERHYKYVARVITRITMRSSVDSVTPL